MSCTNLNQRALPDSGAAAGGLLPGEAGFEQLGPEGKETALGRFGRVDGAAALEEEGALSIAGLAKAEEMAGAIDVAGFKLGGGEAEVAGGAPQISLAEVDEAFDIAAARAAGLAFKPDAIHVRPA